MTRRTCSLALILSIATCAAGRVPNRTMATVPDGSYRPLFAEGGRRVVVPAFRMDVLPVTRAEYATFVTSHPEWRRSAVRTKGYLADWRSDITYGSTQEARLPVTSVTRSAAAAYCRAHGKRLPTLDEWEYSAGASMGRRDGSSDPTFRQLILNLYTRTRPLRPAPVGSGFVNAFGIGDMHGLVWEWVAQEHHMHMMPNGKPHDLTCAGSANGASDPTSFAAFLRYAYRSGLNESSTNPNLGFRCAS
jgi:formylglycine-generating enzyme required for sulfatase activity